MTSFWPEGLNIEDTRSPLEILEQAVDDWKKGGKGIIRLHVDSKQTEDGLEAHVATVVHVASSLASEALLQIENHPRKDYPANALNMNWQKTLIRTPKEFSDWLKEVLNSRDAGAIIINHIIACNKVTNQSRTKEDSE